MYKPSRPSKTTIEINNSYVGESIEDKVTRILSNKEPITDGAPIIYTERKDGVQPAYNIRTDRFEIAVNAMDIVSRNHLAKRADAAKVVEMDTGKDISGAEPLAGTEPNV